MEDSAAKNHDHGHHHHVRQITSLNGIYILSITLNLLYVAVEAGIGFWSNSLGLLSDAGHNLSDVFSLLLAMIAFRLSSSHSTRKFTYGYKKSSVLISLLNAIILLVAIGAIFIESIRKFSSPEEVNGAAVSWTAGIGIIVNGLTAWLLMKQQKHDINTRGAFLHMAADTLVSAGVVVSGVVISLTGWSVIDPIVSIAIVGVILVSTWKLLAESLRMSIDAVPEGIDLNEIKKMMSSVPGVADVHHLHICICCTKKASLIPHWKWRRLHRTAMSTNVINASLPDDFLVDCAERILLYFQLELGIFLYCLFKGISEGILAQLHAYMVAVRAVRKLEGLFSDYLKSGQLGIHDSAAHFLKVVPDRRIRACLLIGGIVVHYKTDLSLDHSPY